ncbi:ankyrin repeat domain-containing protein [Micromonospora sp. IBHARD004]|uniref:ankyrin repeat domain-containing protein n=1 Tax=Micromonospora sp. IBHARD004 TaxID=3457764 RepID=UPI004058F516
MDHDVVRRLVDAVNAGDDAGVEEALTLGADPNVTAGRFRGPVLSLAAGSGHLRIVRLLLDAGASAGSTDPHMWSPLRAAVCEAHPDVAELLIERGALAAEPVVRGSVLANAVAYASTGHGRRRLRRCACCCELGPAQRRAKRRPSSAR